MVKVNKCIKHSTKITKIVLKMKSIEIGKIVFLSGLARHTQTSRKGIKEATFACV